jgi:glycosyltransferase involved in cell wall biosynthesis
MSTVTIVIPTLNEGRTIGAVIDGVRELADEIIVVDGHSTDGTDEVAKGRGVKVIYDSVGKGSALRAGFREATGDIVVMIDADEANGWAEVAKVIELVGEGYDVVMPSRFMAGGGSDDITPLRAFGNSFYKFWLRILWGVSFTDICYGFRGFKREALNRLNLKSDGFDIETEISIRTVKEKLRFIEVPSKEGRRRFGSGKLSFWTSLTIDKRILLELLS